MCHILFEPEATWSNGAFRALFSLAVHICLHTVGYELENTTLPLPIA